VTGSLRDLTLADFLDAVAARTSAPGGGAAAGTAAALAAALVAMALRFGEPGPATEQLVAQAEELRRRAAPLADDDAAAYGDYLRAVRAARDGSGTEDAVTAALSTAAEVPARIAEVALEVAELASRVLGDGNPRLRGDAATGAMLAAAAARAAALLVAENCGRDDPRADRVATAAVRAEDHAEAAGRLLGG
jgi:formiminotetrahydrofolate cyclodeaminase